MLRRILDFPDSINNVASALVRALELQHDEKARLPVSNVHAADNEGWKVSQSSMAQ